VFLARLADARPRPRKAPRARSVGLQRRRARERETVLGVRRLHAAGYKQRSALHTPLLKSACITAGTGGETTGSARRARPPVAWAPAGAARLW